jgi:hypothetical protein
MGKYDKYKNLNATPDERLGFFGNQMMEELVVIQGYSSLIIQLLETHEITELPIDLKQWLVIVKRAADNLAELREVLIMQRK